MEIYAGTGDDVIKQITPGTIIHTGEGKDKVELGDVILYTDLSADDRLVWAGQTLTGAVKSATSESAYATNGALKYGFNKVGEMIIKTPKGHETFVANDQVGPDTTAAERTAGLYIFEKSISFTRLLDPDLPKDWWSDLWRLQLGETAKALTGQSLYGGVDPLVLDLDSIGSASSAWAMRHGPDRADVA